MIIFFWWVVKSIRKIENEWRENPKEVKRWAKHLGNNAGGLKNSFGP